MRFQIFLRQRRAHPPSTFSSPAHGPPWLSSHVGTCGRLVPSCACPVHARENARSFEYASGRRSGRASRESARGPEEKRAAGEGEEGARVAGGSGERGGGGGGGGRSLALLRATRESAHRAGEREVENPLSPTRRLVAPRGRRASRRSYVALFVRSRGGGSR